MKSILESFGWVCVAVLLLGGLGVGPGCGGGGTGVEPVRTGRAALGPLAGATVQIYEVRPGADFQLLFTETTHDDPDLRLAGTFDAHLDELRADGLYLIKATGGQALDVDVDGVADATPTPNLGSIHAVATGAQLKWTLFQVNVLTEIAYQSVKYLLMAGYEPDAVVEALDLCTTYLVWDDVNADLRFDYMDLLHWDPATEQHTLRKAYRHYGELVDAILEGRSQHVPENAAMLADMTVAFERNIDPAKDVVVDGHYAYVSVEEDGIYVVDITDPRNPVVGPQLDTHEAEGLFLQGTLLYVADDDGLQIVDVSNPMSPFLRGKATLAPGDEMEWADDVVVSGGYAYLAEGEHGEFHVVDVFDPDAPTVVASHQTGRNSADGIALYGHHVLVADGSGLAIVDVSDPLNPAGVAQPEIEGDADEVVVVGHYAYVAAGDEDGLVIFDLTDPTDPQRVATVEAPMDCEGVAVLGDYAYLAQRDLGVQVIDVSDPENPTSLGTSTLFGEGNGLCCYGDYVLVATEDMGGLRVFDMTPLTPDLFTDQRDSPVESEIDTLDADSVVTDGRYAYVVSEDEVVSVDLLDPTKPVVLDSVSLGASMDGEITRVVMQGSLLYVTLGWFGLQIVDVTNPAAMVKRGHYDEHLGPQHFTQDVCAIGNHAFTAEVHFERFLSLDVSNPDAPAYAGGTADYGHGLRGVAPLGASHVCAAWGFAGIRVLDVSDPTSPTVVGGDTLPHVDGDWHDANFVTTIRTHGSYAYVPGDEGVWIVDVSTPTAVTVASQFDSPDCCDFAFHGNHVYMSSWERGIVIADVADPANPALVSRVWLKGSAHGVEVLGDYLLVANGDRFTVIRRPIVELIP